MIVMVGKRRVSVRAVNLSTCHLRISVYFTTRVYPWARHVKLLVFGHRSLIKNITQTVVINILKTCIL